MRLSTDANDDDSWFGIDLYESGSGSVCKTYHFYSEAFKPRKIVEGMINSLRWYGKYAVTHRNGTYCIVVTGVDIDVCKFVEEMLGGAYEDAMYDLYKECTEQDVRKGCDSLVEAGRIRLEEDPKGTNAYYPHPRDGLYHGTVELEK